MADRKRRNRMLRFRLNDAERETVRALARESGCTVSALCRAAAFGRQPPRKPRRRERQAIYQLARIGNNLRQLSRHAVGSRRAELLRRLDEALHLVENTIERLS